jgi:ribosomal protein L3 glutamine methyltransferase
MSLTHPPVLDSDEICQELHTILDFFRFASSLFDKHGLFYGHGTTSPLDDAIALVLGALNLPPDLEPLYFQSRLLVSEKKHLISLIQRRIEEREPVAYLINTSYFANLKFYVDKRVLIPRSPLAELIHENFSPWIAGENIKNVLDIGTGSGCIAIACALFLPQDVMVDAVDISEEALEVARINVAHYGLEDKSHLIHSDLFEGLPAQASYDVIISNPPYVPRSSMTTLPQEYHHEPQSALEAGHDGLEVVDKILVQASHYLRPHGIIIIEVGEAQPFLEQKYPFLPVTWIQFENGGEGVFILTAQDLQEHLADIIATQKTSHL